MKNFNGKLLVLDRSDINTDEIIPAKYLTEISRKALQPYLLEDLKLCGFDAAVDIKDKSVIITRANFGCGSSREHAPWALEANGINMVIAESFARIFKRNMFNCGMMAVELPLQKIDRILERFSGKQAVIETDLNDMLLRISADNVKEEVSFNISDFDRSLILAGGWLEYADHKY